MIQVDLPAAFAIGQIYGAISSCYLKKEPRFFSQRLLGPFNIFMSCCYAPVGMFLLIGWPSWEAMYVTAWLESPFDRPWVAGIYVLFGVVMILLGNVGFILAHAWIRKGRIRWVYAGAAIGLLLTALPFILRWGVWMNVGTHSEVIKNHGGYSFWAPPFFSGWLVVMCYMAVTLVVAGVILRKQAKRLAQEE